MIYLIRHGEAASAWGDAPDPGLSALGHSQAEAVATQLMAKGAQRVVSSPMQRCRETAAPLARLLGTRVTIERAVSEIVTPDAVADRVGWLTSLMAGNWPTDMLRWRGDVVRAIEGLPDGTAVFSHFVAINAAVSALNGDPRVLVFRPGHCSVTVLEHGAIGGLKVHALGSEASTKVL